MRGIGCSILPFCLGDGFFLCACCPHGTFLCCGFFLTCSGILCGLSFTSVFCRAMRSLLIVVPCFSFLSFLRPSTQIIINMRLCSYSADFNLCSPTIVNVARRRATPFYSSGPTRSFNKLHLCCFCSLFVTVVCSLGLASDPFLPHAVEVCHI